MSVDELNVTVESEIKEIAITVADDTPSTELIVESFPDVMILTSGNMGPAGPPGPPGQWVSLSQVEYDALDPPDPETLYVIVE